MVDLADEVSVSWVLGYIVDQHILKKDKKAQQNAEDSDDKSGNSGTGEMAVSAGKPCTESRCGSEDDLYWRVEPAEDSEDAEKETGSRESIRGGAFCSDVLFHINSSVSIHENVMFHHNTKIKKPQGRIPNSLRGIWLWIIMGNTA